MLSKLLSLVSVRFIKFCTVGASGVVVNLALLACFAEGLGIQVNLASALAIEASINSNFFINELWTFKDRRQRAVGVLRRLLRFHLVSVVGGVIQWSVFIVCNLMWVALIGNGAAEIGEVTEEGLLARYITGPILNPPDVGHLKYLSQLLGIGLATFWNYVVNFRWTWAFPRGEEDS
jgi:putative flippase GtrA